VVFISAVTVFLTADIQLFFCDVNPLRRERVVFCMGKIEVRMPAGQPRD
jgi:hypothetical protein